MHHCTVSLFRCFFLLGKCFGSNRIWRKCPTKTRIQCTHQGGKNLSYKSQVWVSVSTAANDLSSVGKENVKMDFGSNNKIWTGHQAKLESKEGLLRIKEEKIDPTKVKLEFLSTAANDMSSVGKEIVKMDFDQIMESEVDIKPKKESKEGLLGIKEEKIDPTKVKLEFLSTAANCLSSVGKEIVKTDQLKTGVDFFKTLDGNKRYICSICEKDFGREGSLKQHNADAHEEKEALKCSKNQYKCSTCDARFFEKVIEKWPKSFKCLICGKALAKNLKKHIIRVHEGKCLGCVKTWFERTHCFEKKIMYQINQEVVCYE